MPAMQSHDYLTPIQGKRLIKPKEYTDCVTSNIIDKQSTNNSKCFKTLQCTSEIYKYSFFPRTIIDWNHLDDNIVRANTVSFFSFFYYWHDQIMIITPGSAILKKKQKKKKKNLSTVFLTK